MAANYIFQLLVFYYLLSKNVSFLCLVIFSEANKLHETELIAKISPSPPPPPPPPFVWLLVLRPQAAI